MTLTIPQPRTPDGGRPPRWDALDLPYEAGLAVLAWADRVERAESGAPAGSGAAGTAGRSGLLPGPVLAGDGRMLLLVPEGSAEELPGLLHWLEWDGVELDLRTRGPAEIPEASTTPQTPRGTALRWVRPPGNGLSAAPAGTDLARLVSVVAAECHRLRLARAARPGGPDTADRQAPARASRASARPGRAAPRAPVPETGAGSPQPQADAFSYASRMLAGTRPRSFTS